MNRADVYKLLDGERNYQDNLPGTRTDYKDRTVGDYITMLHHYMNKLDEAWTMNPGDEQALDVIRKIGGIAVHCMEDHGAPARIAILPKRIPVPTDWPFPEPESIDTTQD